MPRTCPEKELEGRRYRCHFELTLQVMGGKWKPIVLYHLSRGGTMRFGELRRSVDGVTERMLTKCLRELEADRLVNRQIYREVPPRVEYSLTTLGTTLIPILNELRNWGAHYETLVESEEERREGEGERQNASGGWALPRPA